MRAAFGIIASLTMMMSTFAQAQENGSEVFKKCRACHQIGPEAKNAVGPRRTGIVGRKAASAEGFNYSDAMKAAATNGVIWDEVTIDKYLASPKGFIPGNKMIFVGIPDEADRRDVIAYLKSAGGP